MKKRIVPGIALAAAVLLLVFFPVPARASVDTGFRPDRDGFAFANFGDAESVAGIDLSALTGARFHDEIFSHTGHCFGMAMASVERFGRGSPTADIPAAEVMPEIDRVQTGQSFYYVADFFRLPFGAKAYNCTAEYARLYARLSEGRPAVIGVYATAGDHPGHAVVAYMIETAGEKSYIYVYDPNFPAAERNYTEEPLIAVYDAADGTFLYDNGKAFDEMRLDDVDGMGVTLGKMLSAGFLGVPFAAVALLIRRPRSPRQP